MSWCVSSAWLECLPVTQEVTGSSPVRTAKEISFEISFFLSYGFAACTWSLMNGTMWDVVETMWDLEHAISDMEKCKSHLRGPVADDELGKINMTRDL